MGGVVIEKKWQEVKFKEIVIFTLKVQKLFRIGKFEFDFSSARVWREWWKTMKGKEARRSPLADWSASEMKKVFRQNGEEIYDRVGRLVAQLIYFIVQQSYKQI